MPTGVPRLRQPGPPAQAARRHGLGQQGDMGYGAETMGGQGLEPLAHPHRQNYLAPGRVMQEAWRYACWKSSTNVLANRRNCTETHRPAEELCRIRNDHFCASRRPPDECLPRGVQGPGRALACADALSDDGPGGVVAVVAAVVEHLLERKHAPLCVFAPKTTERSEFTYRLLPYVVRPLVQHPAWCCFFSKRRPLLHSHRRRVLDCRSRSLEDHSPYQPSKKFSVKEAVSTPCQKSTDGVGAFALQAQLHPRRVRDGHPRARQLHPMISTTVHFPDSPDWDTISSTTWDATPWPRRE